MFFTQPRDFQLSPFQRTKTTTPPPSERKGRNVHFFKLGEKSAKFPENFFFLAFLKKENMGQCCAKSSPLWDKTAALKDEGGGTWICPQAKDVGSGFSYMFKKVLNWDYMMLMPSASPYAQCQIAPGWWDSLSPGYFLHCEMNRLVMMTHFFLLDCFSTFPAQKQGGKSDGDSSHALLLLRVPEVFPKRQPLSLWELSGSASGVSGLFHFTAWDCSSKGRKSPNLSR